jgi:hypothetical protein
LKPLYHVLYTLYKGQPNHGQWVVACLEGSWSKILGERLAAVCGPVSFEKSDLRIEILDRDWDQVMQSVKPALLEKLRTATANEVQSISFSRQWAVEIK